VAVGQQWANVVAYAGQYSYYLATGYTAWWAGGNNGWQFFSGKLDEVAIYQRALTPDEVAQHFAAASEAGSLPIASESGSPASRLEQTLLAALSQPTKGDTDLKYLLPAFHQIEARRKARHVHDTALDEVLADWLAPDETPLPAAPINQFANQS
jgi:hypothetical protein